MRVKKAKTRQSPCTHMLEATGKNRASSIAPPRKQSGEGARACRPGGRQGVRLSSVVCEVEVVVDSRCPYTKRAALKPALPLPPTHYRRARKRAFKDDRAYTEDWARRPLKRRARFASVALQDWRTVERREVDCDPSQLPAADIQATPNTFLREPICPAYPPITAWIPSLPLRQCLLTPEPITDARRMRAYTDVSQVQLTLMCSSLPEPHSIKQRRGRPGVFVAEFTQPEWDALAVQRDIVVMRPSGALFDPCPLHFPPLRVEPLAKRVRTVEPAEEPWKGEA